LENYPRTFPELHDEKWDNSLYFLYNITCLLNELYLHLKEKAELIFEISTAPKSIKMKLRLFKSELCRGGMGNFPICKKRVPLCNHAELGERYSNGIENFEMRLIFSKEEGTLLRLTEDPPVIGYR